ncbi:cytochrome c biogenesis protein ResB [Pseudoclavibacter caeni]|jgi:cytochrome c biogenesis protein|uniref:Cytochrome c biogenesis protein ResB n=1 Tax=Pseudoclavibacter caeni TaxID=908846 RepID=A0A7C8BSX6_9MICO|nr:cytochrome c biogenesis protein ResB [Pseudoclavibacter caeni]KAB1633506.1 cytochrome c biogenesis protein ResB [Pseudoclavibacter caeni]NYJ96498.1 cytochrome c biogenesis protein [Pseudoclavibacter caeni]
MSRSSDSPLTPEEHAARPEAAESPRARADRAVAAEEALSSARQAEELPGGATRLGPVGWLRFFWRQLTSMRVALILLLLLAVASVPGSLVPQRGADPNGVTQYFDEHPDLAPWLDRFSLFDVYSSPWYSAVYLLLFVSLIGCILPRIRVHARALVSRPPRTPSRLDRMVGHERLTVAATPVDVIEAADRRLARRHYRRARFDTAATSRRPAALSVSAERGYLRETGNLVFHVALVGVLVAVGVGGGLSYHGQRVIVQGDTFPNTLSSYDSFTPGQWFDAGRLAPFSITLDGFETEYADTIDDIRSGAYGQPTDYTADVTVHHADGRDTDGTIKVNQPLNVDGTDVYLLGNGYAPRITVRDAQGQVVFSDPVPFISQDQNNTSMGVVKVTDIEPEQVGMLGYFYPTATEAHDGIYTSVYPALDNPLLSLNVYVGDLGVDHGVPTSVYTLDPDSLTQIAGAQVDTKALQLRPGETVDLPGGRGTVTLDEVLPYVSLELRHDPTQVWVLSFALVAVLGLVASLFVPRRRVWVRAWNEPVAAAPLDPADGAAPADRCVFEIGGLARGDDQTLAGAVDALAAGIRHDVGGAADDVADEVAAGFARADGAETDGAAAGDAGCEGTEAGTDPAGAASAGRDDEDAAAAGDRDDERA